MIIIYDEENDWINWHYDDNYFDGSFYTVIIPIINNSKCTKFQIMNDKNEIETIDLDINEGICFEGSNLYHSASKLCKNEKRVIISFQFVTDNNISFMNKQFMKIKDIGFTGSLYN